MEVDITGSLLLIHVPVEKNAGFHEKECLRHRNCLAQWQSIESKGWLQRKRCLPLIRELDEETCIFVLPQMERSLSLCGWTLACIQVAWHWQVSTFLSSLSTLSATEWCISPWLAPTCFILQKSNLKQLGIHRSECIFHWMSSDSCWRPSFMAILWAASWQVGVRYPGCRDTHSTETANDELIRPYLKHLNARDPHAAHTKRWLNGARARQC